MNVFLFFSHFILIMSKCNNGIIDITENFETLASNEMVNLTMIAVPGKYQNTTDKTITLFDSDINLEYESMFHLSNDFINWKGTKRDNEGITFIKLKNQTVSVQAVNNFKFLFFDFVSTYSIGSISMFQPTMGSNANIEICEARFNDLESIGRSKIIFGPVYENGSVTFNINLENLEKIDYQPKPNISAISILVNMNKKTVLPNCPVGYDKCWVDNKFQNGFCYDPKSDATFSTGCSNENCLYPHKSENGINVWWSAPGTGRKNCRNSPGVPVTLQSDTNVGELVSQGIVNMRYGTNRMINSAANLQTKIMNVQELIEKQKMNIGEKQKQVTDTEALILQNKNTINKKLSLLDNRNRQLELCIDRNIYWKKVLYVLFGLVIIIVIILLFVTSFLKNKN